MELRAYMKGPRSLRRRRAVSQAQARGVIHKRRYHVTLTVLSQFLELIINQSFVPSLLSSQ